MKPAPTPAAFLRDLQERGLIPEVIQVAKDKPDFPEDPLTLKHINPLAGAMVSEFDWEDLARMLGEPEAEATEEAERLVQFVSELLRYVLLERGSLESIGKRAVAVAYVLNPALLDAELAQVVERFPKGGRTCDDNYEH